MRLLVYNIAYGTGISDKPLKQLWTIHRYIKTSHSHLERIIDFIDESKADIVGLIEVDTGSYRTNFVNQVEIIANHLKHYHHSSVKYGENSLGRKVPIMRKQANAILTREKIPNSNFHYFALGFKKLTIEVEVYGINFFLVHLSLKKKVREAQINQLIEIAKGDRPIIIAGDFNTFSGVDEISELKAELGLKNPNRENLKSFPAWKPRKELDHILCSEEIKITDFQVPDVRFSDHLPLILDFDYP